MNQRVLLRLAIGLLIVAACFGAYQWLRGLGNDPDLLPGDSRGMVAAVRIAADGGQQAVVIDPSGKVTDVPGYRPGARDQAPEWRPDGQRLFFASDREENVFHIFRWRPGSDKPDRRTIGKRTRSSPHFGFPEDVNANTSGLITSSGVVLEYRPKDATTTQLLPPPTGAAVAVESGEGGSDQFTGAYKALGGTSFREARWTLDRTWVVAIMNREEDQVLVAQNMASQVINGQLRVAPPVLLMSGKRLSFDVSTNGVVVGTVSEFRWPSLDSVPEEFIKDGRATTPFVSGVFSFDLKEEEPRPRYLVQIPNRDFSFREIALSPDGKQAALTSGKMDDLGDIAVDQLVLATLPFVEATQPRIAAEGNIKDMRWRSDGQRLIYIKTVEGKQQIFSINSEGSDEARLTNDTNNYAAPNYSPQLAPAN